VIGTTRRGERAVVGSKYLIGNEGGVIRSAVGEILQPHHHPRYESTTLDRETTMRPLQETYGKWFYAQEAEPLPASREASGSKLFAFRNAEDLQRACAENPSLSPWQFDDLVSNGRFLGLANIGVPHGHPRYVQTRRAWIELSLESIFDEIEEYTNNPYMALPNELVFQAYVILDGRMSLVTLHHDDGITVTCPGSDRGSLQAFAGEVDQIAGKRLKTTLKKMRAVTAKFSRAR
jgi:hypothetical protein